MSIIIPNLNGASMLPFCLGSIFTQGYRNLDILLMDNGSTDQSAELAARRYPAVTIIRNEENMGFAGACHLGAALSQGKYLLFCDNDIQVTPDAINELVSVMESDPSIGVAQSKMLLASDPTVIESMGGYFTGTGILYQEERDAHDNLTASIPREIFGAKGAFMIMPRQLYFDLGGFDSDYVAWFEDTDICWRAWLSGQRVVVVPKSVVYHGRSTTTKRLSSNFVLFHGSKNRICTLIKNLDAKELVSVLPVHLAITLSAIVLMALRLRFSEAQALGQAVLWNLWNLRSTLAKRRRLQGLRLAGVGSPTRQLRRRMPIRYLISSGRAVTGI